MIFDLRTERINRGLTVSALSEATGVARQTIRRLEDGDVPQAPTAKKLADYFGVEAMRFYEEREAA